MSEWKTYKLRDVVNILDYKRIPLSSRQREQRRGKYPYYGAQGIIDYIDDYIFDGTYLLVAEDGENLRSKKQHIAQLVSGKYWVNNHAHILESNGLCDIRYICYLLNVFDISGYITGSAQPKLNQANLLAIEISLPPLAEQKRIADILSAIDDKIELNRRINANLEQQAQALYKSWFVDFEPFGGKMPEDWREGILNDILGKIATGLNPRKNFVLGKGNNYYVTIKNMGDNNIYLDDKCDKVDDEALQKINNRSRLQKGDILFSGIGTIGRTYLIDEEPNNWNTSESVFNLRPIKEIPSEFLYLLLLSDWFQQYVNVHAQGAVQQGIRMGDIKSCPMSIPTSVTITNVTKLVKPMISEVKNNQRKNLRLAQLRDTLLPKLMSGKITV